MNSINDIKQRKHCVYIFFAHIAISSRLVTHIIDPFAMSKGHRHCIHTYVSPPVPPLSKQHRGKAAVPANIDRFNCTAKWVNAFCVTRLGFHLVLVVEQMSNRVRARARSPPDPFASSEYFPRGTDRAGGRTLLRRSRTKKNESRVYRLSRRAIGSVSRCRLRSL